MSAFEFVTLAVTGVSSVLAVALLFRTGTVLESLGRSGHMWLDHGQDIPLADQPSEDGPDLPLPKRPLRGRAN